jgi:hypothetical protein
VKPANRIARRAAAALSFAALALGLSAAPALAAPSLGVQLTRQAGEVQFVWVKAASGGQFRLHFDTPGGETGPGKSETANIAFNANIGTVETALNALTNVKGPSGTGSVHVKGVGDAGGGSEKGAALVYFDGGPLANTDVPQLTWSQGTTPLSGGSPRVVIDTPYRAEVSRSDTQLKYLATVKNTGLDPTSGPVTLEVELAPSLQSSVLDAKLLNALGSIVGDGGWSCSKIAATSLTPAKALCTRSDPLAPEASYPPLTVTAALGADLPDHAVAEATISGGGSPSASEEDEFDFTPAKPFEIESFNSEVVGPGGLVDPDGVPRYTQAGGHPYSAGIDFQFTVSRGSFEGEPIESPSKVVIDLARGLVANALAVPEQCPSVEDVIAKTCPPGSAVGEVNVNVVFGTDFNAGIRMPIYSIVPEVGLPAQFSFAETLNLNTPFSIAPRLRADDGYAISLDVTPAPFSPPLRRLNDGFFCSFGAKVTGSTFESCRTAADPAANPIPLTTNPTRCAGAPPTTKLNVDSWQHPGTFVSKEVSDPSNTGCENVDFQPEVSLKPTNNQADTPTGVDVEITMPTDGLESRTRLSQSALDNAVVTFPKGMSLNPAAAHGLGSCTPAQVGLGNNNDPQCPLSSQVGTIEIETPLISETLTGHVFLASQKDNPFKSTLGLYLVFSSEKDGITIKVPGKLEPDPVTGQLTSSFVENPEQPFSRLAIKFNSGPRAPLINPPRCGTYAIHSEMSPWSAASPANPTAEEIVAKDSVYQVTSGPNGAPCPDNRLNPDFKAGLKSSVAGGKSPFVLKLSREDGSQRFTSLGLQMPEGFTAYLKGVPNCPEHVLAGISPAELTGSAELANPACPSASQVGTVQAGAGPGPYPFYANGRIFLAGPYKGAPLSFVAVTPAVAGPFDFGNVVVRNAVYVDPVTAKVNVVSDPIPTIVHGILLDLRDLRVNIDRPNFTAAPTDCKAQAIGAQVGGESENASRSNAFQVGECSALDFKPKLDLRLFGGTKRGSHPRLQATLTARPGDANIAGASVALPHSEFLDQAHIRTVCTRVQFRANACPAGAIYGHAKAITPLLDEPLSGPVYLRSSDNPLPDLVMALRGPDAQPIEVVLAGRIDSVHGGIRSSFEAIPDQPVSSFTLTMKGGKKGLLVNSRDLCKSVNKATVRFSGQNGKTSESRPELQSACSKAKKNKKNKRKG